MRITTKKGPVDRVPTGAVVMLGYFDGFHKGHMALADAAYEIQKRKNAACVMLWTFSRLSKGKTITDNEEKAEAFFSYFPDSVETAVCFEEFTHVCGLSGEEFVDKVLKESLDVSAVVCGFNFRFGKNGAWNSEDLQRFCTLRGMECCVVPPVFADGETISSTELRRLIEAGEAELAAERMGRPYSVKASVVHGKRLGHTLGFPTVNQRIPEDKITPAFGVYACRVRLPDGMKNGVCNIGYRPTVNGDTSDVTLETYIFDYDGDLYGETLTVYLCKMLRKELRFSSMEELSSQIASDKKAAIEYLTGGCP